MTDLTPLQWADFGQSALSRTHHIAVKITCQRWLLAYPWANLTTVSQRTETAKYQDGIDTKSVSIPTALAIFEQLLSGLDNELPLSHDTWQSMHKWSYTFLLFEALDCEAPN
eukprot:TRINITY_DN10815_c0_g1_i3.p1 TRINITY_DN10815_c0_g1~~TRINITY_DN10815_c0_g1_i3.p1  ORF type:complete len:112 (+),score=18.96 TRINITY_DN10815_c0_g1_i3:388-723(+)